LFDSKALTRNQSIALITIIAVAAVGAYVLAGGENQSSETIKIGLCADLDNTYGKSILQGAILAAEHINAEGGILGRNFEIVAEDDNWEERKKDESGAIRAFNRLLSLGEADFMISDGYGITYREIAAKQKIIFFTLAETRDEFTQDVLDNYDKYKYYFRGCNGNQSTAIQGITDSVITCRELTGFNKVAFLYYHSVESNVLGYIDCLNEEGFDVVLAQSVTDVVDYSSAFAKAEAAGAEILYPLIYSSSVIPFVKEYHERQSPMVMWGGLTIASNTDFWEITEGKCEYITCTGFPVVVGYPLTTKTTSTHDAYFERWGEAITNKAAAAYDIIRFILPDAIERAETIETESVIKTLEETDIETSLCRRFVFTPSHDIMVGKEGPNRLSEDYFFVAMFQWQEGKQVPVYPTEFMEEAGASYMFPDWPGPWDNFN